MLAHSETNDVERATAGDHEAFERLYRDHVGRVYALARRMAGEGVAEDLTQEVFIRAWQKLSTFQGQSRFGTWLHRLAVNHILSRRSTMARREAHRADGERWLAGARAPKRRDPESALDLESAMEKLPGGARDVFVLFDIEGYRHEEIAGMMGISVGTSKSQLHRARRMLRDELR